VHYTGASGLISKKIAAEACPVVEKPENAWRFRVQVRHPKEKSKPKGLDFGAGGR
jgi:hypothetical protein